MIPRILLFVLLVLAGPLRAQDAGCASLRDARAVDAAIGAGGVASVQAGLRAVFGPDIAALSDGIIGPVSRAHLEQLCEAVPLTGGTDPVAGTLALAQEYAALSALLPDWPARIADPDLADGQTGSTIARRLLHLAGPPELKRIALTGGGEFPASCSPIPESDLALGESAFVELQAGIAAILEAEGRGNPAAVRAETGVGAATRAGLTEVCALYPAGLETQVLVEAVRRMGRITAAEPGAAGILRAPAFANWLAAAPGERLLRLVGTPEAVAPLLRDSGVVGAVPVTPLACGPEASTGPVYFAFTAADRESLAARASINEALAPVREGRFEGRRALVAAINSAIGAEPASCTATIADEITAQFEDESRVFVLDSAGFDALSLDPALTAILPALQPIVGLESPSRPQLLARIEAAVEAVASEAVHAEIVAAADAAAAAAEEVEPTLDVPAIPMPPERMRSVRAEFAITDPSLLLLRSEVDDAELFEAISETEYEQVGGRPVVRARVLAALQPIAESRVDATVTASLAAVEEAVVMRYRLVAPVADALALRPEFAAVSPDVVERLTDFEGVTYPTRRLYDEALATIAPPLDEVAWAALEDVGRKHVDPGPRREIAPIAAADCGCVARRWEFDSLVYGFYPFWQFAESGAEPAEMPKVDFELVERIAFDGIEIGADARLRYAPRWNEAAATFTVSARRHQAQVDLAIRVREGWRDWSAAQIEDAAFAVADKLTRKRREDPLVTSKGLFGWLDSLHDRRPDGVTLIVDGYTGTPGEPSARNLVALVRAIGDRLTGTDHTINLAFDIPLVGDSQPSDPLFTDLRAVILQTDPLRPKLVEHVIVFVERPTAEAKKLIRARLENSFFGDDRWTVLRHIIPVVPPGGNAAVPHEGGVTLASADAAQPFGQFHDDVLYFHDNFRGVGFWPAPVAGAVLPDGSPDRLPEVVRLEFDEPALPAVLRPYEARLSAVCNVVCPNRLAFYLACAAAGAGILAVRGLSLYSRRVRSAAEAVLLTPILTLVLGVLLVLVAICDRDAAIWAPTALAALFVAVSGLLIIRWNGRRLDGPTP